MAIAPLFDLTTLATIFLWVWYLAPLSFLPKNLENFRGACALLDDCAKKKNAEGEYEDGACDKEAQKLKKKGGSLDDCLYKEPKECKAPGGGGLFWAMLVLGFIVMGLSSFSLFFKIPVIGFLFRRFPITAIVHRLCTKATILTTNAISDILALISSVFLIVHAFRRNNGNCKEVSDTEKSRWMDFVPLVSLGIYFLWLLILLFGMFRR
tara:strand:+ start:705 stop:1331 length:627 start_codon:yes stop_codon:yes gene_type:complete